jgi:hypothetical protein
VGRRTCAWQLRTSYGLEWGTQSRWSIDICVCHRDRRCNHSGWRIQRQLMYLLEDNAVRLDIHQTACRHQHPLRPATAHTISNHPSIIITTTSNTTAIINSSPLEY